MGETRHSGGHFDFHIEFPEVYDRQQKDLPVPVISCSTEEWLHHQYAITIRLFTLC